MYTVHTVCIYIHTLHATKKYTQVEQHTTTAWLPLYIINCIAGMGPEHGYIYLCTCGTQVHALTYLF